MNIITVLCIGDLVGDPGRAMFARHISQIKKDYNIDVVIVNGENSASDGRGITPQIMGFFKNNGVDIVTSGNHIWAKKEIYAYLTENKDLLRPINFPNGCPGTGIATIQYQGITLGIINVQGRTFMQQQVNCPLRAVDSALTFLKSRTNCIIVDMHAEASSEKMALAYYLDGQVSAVIGTHTHVQTADERILPKGTAYITDIGMGGALHSLIGMKQDIIIKTMLTQMPMKFVVETEGPLIMCGVVIAINTETGKAQNIKRLYIVDDNT